MMLYLYYSTFRNLRKIKKTDLVICTVAYTISILPRFMYGTIIKINSNTVIFFEIIPLKLCNRFSYQSVVNNR